VRRWGIHKRGGSSSSSSARHRRLRSLPVCEAPHSTAQSRARRPDAERHARRAVPTRPPPRRGGERGPPLGPRCAAPRRALEEPHLPTLVGGSPPPPPLTPPLAVSHAASEAPPCVSWLSCRRCDGAWQSIAAGQRGGGARAWRGAGRGAAAAPMPGKSADAGSVADRLAPLLSSHAVVTGLEGGGGCGQNRLAADWKGKPIIPARRDSFTLQFAACGHSAPPNDTSGVQ